MLLSFVASEDIYIESPSIIQKLTSISMTVNSAVILMCQSCNDGGYLFIITILLPFLAVTL